MGVVTQDSGLPRLSYDGTAGRQMRATALGRGTHGVEDVARLVESQFHVAFPHRIWVAGQVAPSGAAADGALCFVIHGATGEQAFRLECTVPAESRPAVRDLLLRDHDADVEDVVREGRLARLAGLLRFDVDRCTAVLTVSEIDPTPTAARLDEDRLDVLRVVAATGLAGRQRSKTLGAAPLEVALVGDVRDGALQRAAEQLDRSAYGVHVRLVPIALTGADAGTVLAGAIHSAARGSDVVLLVRDEGRPLGLGCYDTLEVVRAVAEARVPVVTGLGGSGARTACDEAAHASVATAELAVDWVVTRLARAEQDVQALAAEIERAAGAAGVRFTQVLDDARDETTRAVRDAATRGALARERQERVLRIGCALFAVLAGASAVVAGTAWFLLALLAPAALLAGAPPLRKLWATSGRKQMSQRNEEFTQVIKGLHEVRDELSGTPSLERIGVLRGVAERLETEGRQLLGRALEPVGREVLPGASPVAAVDLDQRLDLDASPEQVPRR